MLQALEVVGLAEGVGGELPVHAHVEMLLGAIAVTLEAPVRKVVGHALEQGVGVNAALRIGVHPDEAKALTDGSSISPRQLRSMLPKWSCIGTPISAPAVS